MISKTTQIAIAILQAISSKASEVDWEGEQVSELLNRLETAQMIRRKEAFPKDQINSYELLRPIQEISLLDVLEATGEHLDCNRPTTEEFYSNYGRSGQKLGVVNYMTRLYLKEIKLFDL